MSFVGRLRRLRATMFLATLVCGAAGCDGCTAPRPTQPHVFIFLVDTLRPDHLGCYGYTAIDTPAIDAFARDAIVFDNARSVTSWTRPAVASLLSGLHPLQHGANTVDAKINDDVTLLSGYLKRRGYLTSGFVTNGNVIAAWGFDRGFDEYRAVRGAGSLTTATELNDVAIGFLETKLGEARPLFAYLHTMDPHAPYQAPPPFGRPRSDAQRAAIKPSALIGAPPETLGIAIAAYDETVAYTDHELGRFLEFLKRSGIYDDSLIVFTSDHGEEFLEHGGSSHGHSLYDELLRVPLIIKLPNNEAAGTRSQAPVSLLDVVPTVLSIVGADVPKRLQGTTLLPIVRGEDADAANPWELTLHLDVRSPELWHRADGVVRGSKKLIRVHSPDRGVMLFDFSSDPGETKNLSAGDATVVAELVSQVTRALEKRVESVPIEPPVKVVERLRALGYGVGSGAQ